jgi:Phenylalanyl-tRNA synthetase alpha subunit
MALSVDAVDIKKRIESCKNLQEVEGIRLEYLGKKGLIPSEMKLLGNLSIDERKLKGQELNKLKSVIEEAIDNQKSFIENQEIEKKLQNENIDVTLPQLEITNGKIHPISQTIFSIIEIFGNLNYSVEAGPDIESDFNNFSALNIPPHHPAREMQDTFYVQNSDGEDNVLRTHTSPVQVRTMLKTKPPIKIIVPGRTYRSDSDSTHTPMFHQVEGLVVNKDATMADLKSTLITFLKEFFEIENLKYRFRPSYFPFTEPSAEMDVAFTKKNNV